MKKIFATLIFLSLTLTGFAQMNADGGISGGFVIKTSSYALRGNTYSTTGLYTQDGTTLVAVFYYDYGAAVSVAPGTTTIAPNAFLSANTSSNISNIVLPNSVNYLYPNSLLVNYYQKESSSDYATWVKRIPKITLSDDIQEETTSAKAANLSKEDAREVGRYNLQGQRLSKPTRGVNIVQMSDQTAYKELIK